MSTLDEQATAGPDIERQPEHPQRPCAMSLPLPPASSGCTKKNKEWEEKQPQYANQTMK
jgi:hypothetical protein